jgi:probable phosphoglycerate mutase
VYVDGGARGNPGPAAAGVVVAAADDGTVLHEGGHFLGEATNNVAEYRSLLAGMRTASRLGATEIEVLSDSELLVRQMTGEYRVRNERLKELHAEAQELAERFASCSYTHIRREQNARADELVNRALNLRRDVGDAG